MAHKTKEIGQKRKNPIAISTPSCPTRRAEPFPTKPRIPSANTRIGCQWNKSRILTEQPELFVLAVP
jgi:hypothetical protein